MNRAALVEQIQEARKTLEKLLTRFQSAPVERDRFVSHLYQSRREYRRTCETAGKSGKQIERSVISSFRIAAGMGFKGVCVSRRICCESDIDRGKLSRLIPSVAGERHQTVLPQIGNLDYRRCVSPDL
jgi:hypothetical protein